MAVIEIAGLSKTYRPSRLPRRGRPRVAVPALDRLDLTVEAGGVHGFLGPNGSGKTTTIRVLLGLVRADAGDVRILGHPVPAGLPAAIAHVGALVETPLFFPAFTGRRNLQLLATAAGVPSRQVEETLEVVELRDRANDRFKGYSLGMKQRLGIAAALLKSPRLLILDEPSNGLDPAGIRDVRELVRRLGGDGRTTVLLSSHLLGEIALVCDTVSILARGRCVASGPVAGVLAAQTAGAYLVRLADPSAGVAVLRAAGFTVAPTADGLQLSGVTAPAEVTRVLAEHGLYVEHLAPLASDLERVFFDLTTGVGVQDGEPPPAGAHERLAS